MSEQVKQPDIVTPEVQEVMRNLVTAIRAVKLYPPNNPVYAQSIKKASDSLVRYLGNAPQYPLGVQKTYFAYQHVPVAKDAQVNKPIAQDLYAKGIREILFLTGVTESELLVLFRSLALSPEELAMRSGIVSILWEKGATHIQVTEAALDEVIVAKSEERLEERVLPQQPPEKLPDDVAAHQISVGGRTLVLGDLMNDPKTFANAMLELAKATAGEHETVGDRLHALYRDAGRKIQEAQPERTEVLFDGLAQSVLEMDPKHRDQFINGKLYGDLDAESAYELHQEMQEQVPHDIHEIMTGRFTKAWTVQQVATLLKKSATKEEAGKKPVSPFSIIPEPIPADLEALAREMGEYTPEEMESLRGISEAGMESDIIEASVRTLIFLLPLVRNPDRNETAEKEISLFSGVIHQLEDMLSYLLKQKDFGLAMIIIRALRGFAAPPEFRPRLNEALRKASTREIIAGLISVMRSSPKSSPKYEEAYSFVKMLAQEATPILLESLAAEQDRAARLFVLDLLKDLGKGQISTIAQGLNDSRWYVVRNVVSILAESKSDQAVIFLEKVADHKNQQIRQEVIKGLIGIGGRRASALLARYLADKDRDIQFTALRALSMIQGAGADEAQALMEFLEQRRIVKKKEENDLTVEAIRTLGKIGRPNAAAFLQRYERIRWWRARRPQEELRAASRDAISEITKRRTDAGRTK